MFHSTPGHIPVEFLTMFGVSAKLDEETAIGRFGTGFKFAIATLLRNGAVVTVTQPDGECFKFSTRPETFRDKTFHRVLLNDQPLAFTTDLGSQNWTIEMAFRELHSNTLDENGQTGSAPIAGWANIEVQHSAYNAIKVEDWFIGSRELLHNCIGSKIYAGESRSIFHRGVCVWTLSSPLPYTFDFEQCNLTEDRTLLGGDDRVSGILFDEFGYFPESVQRGLFLSLHPLVEKPRSLYLYSTAVEAIGELVAANHYVPEEVYTAWRREVPVPPKAVVLSSTQQEILHDVLQWMAECGWEFNWPVQCANLPDGFKGLCDYQNSVIQFSPRLFADKNKLAHTLLEEWIHMTTHAGDYTREFQNTAVQMIIAQAQMRRPL